MDICPLLVEAGVSSQGDMGAAGVCLGCPEAKCIYDCRRGEFRVSHKRTLAHRLKAEGWLIRDIARHLNYSIRTVERRLKEDDKGSSRQ